MLPRDQEILDMLAEECAEVIVEVMKINRHGIESSHPDEPEASNRLRLRRELVDLKTLIDRTEIFLVGHIYEEEMVKCWTKKQKYTHHQGAPK